MPRLAAWGLSLLLAAGMLIPSSGLAFADVRKSDVIFGKTVDSRGLSVVQCPDIEAEYAAVLSSDGDIFFERAADEPVKIASITKIMTALVALDYASSDTLVYVSQRAANVGESSASLQAGDSLSFEDALRGLMISSGNDASIALAETIGSIISGGSLEGEEAEQVFVDAMNAKAEELGLIDSYFTNPHGLDFGMYEGEQHSCALDVATLACEAMKNDTFRQIVASSQASISVLHYDGTVGELHLETTNALLDVYEGNCGVKTGITESAGYCFAGAIHRGETEIYTVILKGDNENSRFIDTESLGDWAFSHLISFPLVHSEKTVRAKFNGETQDIPIVAEVAHSDWIDKRVKASIADPFQEIPIFDLKGNIYQTIEYYTITGDVHEGDVVGSITFKQRDEELIRLDLVAYEDLAAPSFLEGCKIWWKRFVGSFAGKAKVADSILLNKIPLIDSKFVE